MRLVVAVVSVPGSDGPSNDALSLSGTVEAIGARNSRGIVRVGAGGTKPLGRPGAPSPMSRVRSFWLLAGLDSVLGASHERLIRRGAGGGQVQR